MREAGTPDANGQQLEVDDRDGNRWQVECLGEPVEVGARIAFEPIGAEEKRRGQMMRLLEAARESWVCRVQRSRGDSGAYSLIPFGGLAAPELQLAEKDARGAADGVRVVVVPLEAGRGGRPKRSDKPRRAGRGETSRRPVRVIEILGPPGDPDADHRAVAWKHRLPERFSRRARLEADAIDGAIAGSVLRERVDLRHLPFITIDPASARDHDDAVFAEERAPAPALRVEGQAPRTEAPRQPSWTRRLWVAIADVSHFVEPGGFIDAEARRRANSFYFPDRSIPMLPERLSSDLCSLRPDVDRLAMVVELRMGAKGVVLDALFHEAVIRSRARLAYEEAAAWLEDQRSAAPPSSASPREEWADSLLCLDRIATELGDARSEAGGLAIELPEVEIVVDDSGRPVDACLRARNRAHILIEEAMLAANRAVARALDRAERPTVHRVHAPPPPAKLAELARRFAALGIELSGDLDAPGVLTSALDAVRGLPSEERMNMAVLRAMSQARYEAESGGHYALRFDHYLHFTSPIRRYADLEVHRTLRRLIRGEPAAGAPERDRSERERLARLGLWLSGRERLATEAERDAEALASCALMAGRMDEVFEAEVTGATEYGLFIRLASPCVSGLIPMRTLDGRWEVDAETETLVADRSGAAIAVGDALRVRPLSVDFDLARLAFRIDSDKRRGGRRERESVREHRDRPRRSPGAR